MCVCRQNFLVLIIISDGNKFSSVYTFLTIHDYNYCSREFNKSHRKWKKYDIVFSEKD